MLPVVHMKPLPNGVCDWFSPWKKMLFWFGTGCEVSVRSPADELEEPDEERSAGRPVELVFAVQYFVPGPASDRTNASTWLHASCGPSRTVRYAPAIGAANVVEKLCQLIAEVSVPVKTSVPKSAGFAEIPTSTLPKSGSNSVTACAEKLNE